MKCKDCLLWDETRKTCWMMAGSLNCEVQYEANDYCSKGIRKSVVEELMNKLKGDK